MVIKDLNLDKKSHYLKKEVICNTKELGGLEDFIVHLMTISKCNG